MDAIIFHHTSWGVSSHLSVVEAVHKAGYTCIVQDDSPDSSYIQAFIDAGIPCLNWADYETEDIRKNAAMESASKIDALLELMENPDVNQGFGSPSGQFLNRKADTFFRSILNGVEDQIRHLETLKAIKSKFDISLLIVGDDHRVDARALIAFASGLKIPTLALRRGIGEIDLSAIHTNKDKVAELSSMTDELREGPAAIYANAVAVDGAVEEERLLKWGIDADQVFVTGSTLYDARYPREESDYSVQVEAKTKLNLNIDRPVIAAAFSTLHREPSFFALEAPYVQAYHDAVVELVTSCDAQLILWGHDTALKDLELSEEERKTLIAEYIQQLEAAGISSVVQLNAQDVELLPAAEFAVCPADATGVVDFMIAGVPVVYVQRGSDSAGLYEANSGMMAVHEPAALVSSATSLVGDKARQDEMRRNQSAYVHRLNFNHDGKAAKRLSQLILKLASRRGEYTASQWNLELRALEKKASYEDLIQKKLASLVIDTDM